MCGIAGIVNFGGRATRVDESVLIRMRDAMTHRGPDGAGTWLSADQAVGLGHRRLSIIDLSAAAAQPMCNENGDVWVTYNGEMYNHLALREQLTRAGHRFKTDHSDTEVLVHGYEEWGIDGLAGRIEGDYAFALWDGRMHQLWLMRDRIGVKPLYFSLFGDTMVFASEIKALLEHPGVVRDVDTVAMYHYLSFMTTPAPLTMFRGIYKLPAGFYLGLSRDGKITAKRYWDAVPGQSAAPADVAGMDFESRERYYIAGITTRLRAAVSKRMMSDVPFGVFLSGGIDSSTNVALMSECMTRPVDTFTVGFKDHTHLNELEYADAVAKRFNTRHHQILIDEGDMKAYLEHLVYSQDEPVADWVCIPLYFVSKLTRDSGTTVVQVGEGSDEQFCGYSSYMSYLDLYRRYWNPYRKFAPAWVRRVAAGAGLRFAGKRSGRAMYADILDRAARGREHFWGGAVVFWNALKRHLIDDRMFAGAAPDQRLVECGLLPSDYYQADSFNIVRSFLAPFDACHPRQDVLTRMIYTEFKARLPELLLMRVDKIGMSTSIEARVPFLDHHLVEFTMDIPMEHKVRNGEAKYLLKKAVAGMIPDEIIYRKKMGFGAPMSQWLRGDFGKEAEGVILGSKLLQRPGFNTDFIAALCRDHRSGKQDNAVYIWTLYNLAAWYGYWFERRAS
jgi:asparagine synthase (glutamine-hydrolysing)